MSSQGGGAPPAGAQVVYGIPVQNDVAALYASRVISVALTLFLIAIIDMIITLVNGGSVVTVVVNLILSLMLPACGWFGVRNRSQSLIYCFVFFNACIFVLQIIVVILAINAGVAAIAIVFAILFSLINFAGCYFGYKLITEAPEYFADTAVPVAAVVGTAQPVRAQPQSSRV